VFKAGKSLIVSLDVHDFDGFALAERRAVSPYIPTARKFHRQTVISVLHFMTLMGELVQTS
jgi:hypothetical protein